MYLKIYFYFHGSCIFFSGATRLLFVVNFKTSLFECRVNDIIVQVNDVNVESVVHGVAVQALKDSGNSARLVSHVKDKLKLLEKTHGLLTQKLRLVVFRETGEPNNSSTGCTQVSKLCK